MNITSPIFNSTLDGNSNIFHTLSILYNTNLQLAIFHLNVVYAGKKPISPDFMFCLCGCVGGMCGKLAYNLYTRLISLVQHRLQQELYMHFNSGERYKNLRLGRTDSVMSFKRREFQKEVWQLRNYSHQKILYMTRWHWNLKLWLLVPTYSSTISLLM